MKSKVNHRKSEDAAVSEDRRVNESKLLPCPFKNDQYRIQHDLKIE
jgi:hypothetical protein